MSAIVIFTIVSSMVAVLVAMAGLLVSILKRGQNEGRLMEILSSLKMMMVDHETRIRSLESHRR